MRPLVRLALIATLAAALASALAGTASAARYVKVPGYFLHLTGSGSLDYALSLRFHSADYGSAELDLHATANYAARPARPSAAPARIFRRRVPRALMGETARELNASGPMRVTVNGAIDDIDDGNHGRAHFSCTYDTRFEGGSGFGLTGRRGAGWLGAFQLTGALVVGQPSDWESACTMTSDEPGRDADPRWRDQLARTIADLAVVPANPGDDASPRGSGPTADWGPFGRDSAAHFVFSDAALRRRHLQVPVAGALPDSYTDCHDGYRYADLTYDVASCSQHFSWSGKLDARKRCSNHRVVWFLYQRKRVRNGGIWYCLKRGQYLSTR